ncbi:hypothetical protein RchiOBHm_Chr5g0001111 [Rosa chinensis]|uniref:Uncharacterized protein n=1 Tax=Rosa chinensis TaxID=74649 RepID=A0A2P6Q256_ROSCH|nr:hypothetical protein RchiOBHm_Chr5g0001111 [Rosa chinensis]
MKNSIGQTGDDRDCRFISHTKMPVLKVVMVFQSRSNIMLLSLERDTYLLIVSSWKKSASSNIIGNAQLRILLIASSKHTVCKGKKRFFFFFCEL